MRVVFRTVPLSMPGERVLQSERSLTPPAIRPRPPPPLAPAASRSKRISEKCSSARHAQSSSVIASSVLSKQRVDQRPRTKRSLARLGLKGADSRHRVAGPGAARYSFRAYEWRGYVPTFKAIVVEKSDDGQKVHLTDFDEANLMEGDVTVSVEWSTVNYKDGLAMTGNAAVISRFKVIAGYVFA